MLKQFWKFTVHIFAFIGAGLVSVIVITNIITCSRKSDYKEPITEIKFDVYVPNRTDTLHRTITTSRGECRIDRYDRWTYALKSKESGRIIWKESYPIKIISQKVIER